MSIITQKINFLYWSKNINGYSLKIDCFCLFISTTCTTLGIPLSREVELNFKTNTTKAQLFYHCVKTISPNVNINISITTCTYYYYVKCECVGGRGGGQNDLEKCVISDHLTCYDVNNPYVIVVARYFRFL